ncbi:hypothetical protein B5E65_07550 [Gemmiger sp. An120]|uniref:hypothetical protein n=1 Tax=Gemmiger sp. An120 TaxID=1965549 RepID=UPI000B368A32|nr:hypothetical protein [Gemmiger sp. An120]OUQ42468.1 hypothetical protein B5E65_07550 [Gemmiger sp. An120]HIX33459.1 hypothetical protein [Candidatus Gemmiger avium]
MRNGGKQVVWLLGTALAAFTAGCLLLAGREWGWGTSAVLFAAPAWLAGALARTRRGSVLAGMAAGLGVWAALGCRPLLLAPALAAGGVLGTAGLRWQLGGRDWLSLAVCIEGAAVLLLGGSPAMAAGRVAAGLLLAILAAWTPVAEPTAAARQLPAKE